MLAATGEQLKNQWPYHGFRLLAYLGMGAISGYLGHEFLFAWKWVPIQVAFTAVVLSILIILMIETIYPKIAILKTGINRSLSAVSQVGIRWGLSFGKGHESIFRAAFVGFFTVFLPCGWLYGFILMALATRSALSGAMILSVFWLGTIPALMSSRVIIQAVFARLGVKGARVVSLVMILAALISMFEHWKHAALKAGSVHPDSRPQVCNLIETG